MWWGFSYTQNKEQYSMSNLLKMNLALSNRTLKKRVQAALVNLAQQQKDATDQHGAFARIILTEITREWHDFILAVAANQDIQNALVLSDDRSFVVTTLVEDAQIVAVVEATYWETSKKYAPQTNNEGEEETEGGDPA